MFIKVLCVFSTQSESAVLDHITGIRNESGRYMHNNSEIIPLITGVGSVATAWSMKQWLSENELPDLAVNIGIAGSYRDDFKIGDVVVPVSDCFADAGIEDNDDFLTLGEAGLSDPDHFPFSSGVIYCKNKYADVALTKLLGVKAITVNTATGSDITMKKLVKKYNPDIESMEGATFFYICSRENIPFLALRAISNKVEPRNRSNWNIPLALISLSEKIDELLTLF
jgi:futalosine hydrolase